MFEYTQRVQTRALPIWAIRSSYFGSCIQPVYLGYKYNKYFVMGWSICKIKIQWRNCVRALRQKMNISDDQSPLGEFQFVIWLISNVFVQLSHKTIHEYSMNIKGCKFPDQNADCRIPFIYYIFQFVFRFPPQLTRI